MTLRFPLLLQTLMRPTQEHAGLKPSEHLDSAAQQEAELFRGAGLLPCRALGTAEGMEGG